MKIFLICPVRNATEEQRAKMDEYIKKIENNGDSIYYPARDTNQADDIGLRICADNRKAIIESDEVHVYFDKNSTGTLFDLGMAFALGKKIVLVNKDQIEKTDGKSFSNMIMAWEETGN